MGWLDLTEYKQIDDAAQDRVADLLSAAGSRQPSKHAISAWRRRTRRSPSPKRSGVGSLAPAAPLAAAAQRSSLATMLYAASKLRARPRMIDGYIDYFGDPVLN